MFTIHTRRGPEYLTDSVQARNSYPAQTHLRYTVPYYTVTIRCFRPSHMEQFTSSLPAAVLEADN